MKKNGLVMHLGSVITCLSISSFAITAQAEGVTFGAGTNASGNFSAAFGLFTSASGGSSAAFGESTIASGGLATSFGLRTTALGDYSTAFGFGTTASGKGSTAFGDDTTASGVYSAAFGHGPTASGDYSAAFGYQTEASGFGAMAFGGSSMALGSYALAAGVKTESSGHGSVAFGFNAISSGKYSAVFGLWTEAQALGQLVLGEYNYLYPDVISDTASPHDPIFVVGNGDSHARSNAMTVFRNGHTVLHNNLTVLGRISTASDERMKHSITPLTNSMDRIRQLSPVSYIANNDDTNKIQIGFIAQEVELTVPEVVHIDQEGNYSVAYGQVTALLTDAVQTLDVENKQLKAALCELKSTLEFCN